MKRSVFGLSTPSSKACISLVFGFLFFKIMALAQLDRPGQDAKIEVICAHRLVPFGTHTTTYEQLHSTGKKILSRT
jgi:hypothetical protein